MIIIKLQGGLGNQMFQYAIGYCLAEKYNTELRFDTNYLLNRSIKHRLHVNRDLDLDIFGLNLTIACQKDVSRLRDRFGIAFADKTANRIFGLKNTYIREPRYQFTPDIMECGSDVYLEGFWQSEKYFKPVEQAIRAQFVIKDRMEADAAEFAKKISAENAVCVNVRRGDFIANPFHVVLTPEFYQRAENILLSKIDQPLLYVFSDDLAWCQENLHFQSPVTFVSHGYSGKKFQDYFRLMSSCKSFIIPNSTFAWWAAYLSNSESKTVITPTKWYNDESWSTEDLLLKHWLTID